MAMLLGIFLHYVYLTTRSLWMPMLLHFMVNSFSVTADKISEISNIRMEAVDTAPEKIPWIIYVASALLLAAVAWALYRSRTRLAVLGEKGIVPYHPDFPSVEYPPADSISVVSHPWPGWMASSLVLAGVCAFAGCFYLAALQS